MHFPSTHSLTGLALVAGLVLAPATTHAQEQLGGSGESAGGSVTLSEEGDKPKPVVITAAEEDEIGPDSKRMTATPTPQRPILDGVVDDDVWQYAEVVSDFLTREPIEAGQPSQRTEVRILFDEENIYIGFIAYDDDPGAILASDLRRDSRLETDDTVAVIFDTFHDHRNGFLFRVNPLGTRYDATVKDERDINSQWDERWGAAARITERGWEAELEIPWSALRFSAGSHVWGIDFKREIRRNNEKVNWSNFLRGFDFRNVSQSGHIVGFRNLRLTDRFRVKPYMAGGYSAFNATDEPFRESDGQFGVEDFKVQISPNLTADLTINTDFAQVEDDQQRVNLSRFPLFFPERREFFIEGADKFQFGGAGGHRGFGGPDVLLYHSRQIGLYAGNPVPMRYGAKMTGKMDGTSMGFINAQTGDALEFGYLGRNYTALRVKQDVLQRSAVGVMFTNVQGSGEYNRVAAVDASFRFLDHMGISGYVAQASDSGIDGPRYVGAFRAGWDSDLWSASASYSYVDPDFATDLGFVRRSDMISQDYSVGISPRPSGISWMRQIWLNASTKYITDTSGEIETRSQTGWTRFQFESGDSANVSVTSTFERLKYGFSSSGLVWVAPGDYSQVTWRASVDSYKARRISGRLSASGGGYLGRDPQVLWRANDLPLQREVLAEPELRLQPNRSAQRRLRRAGRVATRLLQLQRPLAHERAGAVQQRRRAHVDLLPAQLHSQQQRRRLPGLQVGGVVQRLLPRPVRLGDHRQGYPRLGLLSPVEGNAESCPGARSRGALGVSSSLH